MKKKFTKLTVITLALLMVFAFASCGKKETKTDPAPDTTVTVEDTADVLAGTTYKMTSSKIGDEETTTFENPETYKFGTDGTFELATEDFDVETEQFTPITYKGTYSVSGNTATVNLEVDGQSSKIEFNIDGDTITSKSVAPGPDGAEEETVYVYTKAN